MNATIRTWLFWPCLVVTPLVLGAMELFHPAGFTRTPGMFQFLCRPMPPGGDYKALAYPGPDWWFTMHFIQTPLVGLLSVGLWLLAGKVRDGDGALAVGLAWLARAATLVFFVYYTALDSIGGTGLGRLILNTQHLVDTGRLTPEQLEGVTLLLNTTWVDPWVGGVGSFISLTGSWAIFAASVLTALALLATRRVPLLPLLGLAAFGWELQTSHASPHGPAAFAILTLSALWIWWSGTREPARRDQTLGAVAAA